jgi:hypothetical protein
VGIDVDRIERYAATLWQAHPGRPVPDPSCHWLNQGTATVAFFITLNSINFGSGYFPYLRKRPGMSGYFTIASALTEHFRRRGPLTAEELCRLTAADCGHLLGQTPLRPPVDELMQSYAEALNDLGRLLRTAYHGRCELLLEAAGASAVRLVQLLTVMPKFADGADYGGRRVLFLKRAQLSAADLYWAFGGRTWGRFNDIRRLTIFADNLVPHVLHLDKILHYAPPLRRRIIQGELIPAGSAEEVELRACALHAVELMVQSLRSSGCDTCAARLDPILWNRGQQPAYKAHPRHRTRCVFY